MSTSKAEQLLLAVPKHSLQRVRPSDSLWPKAQQWETLRAQLNGGLKKGSAPLAPCAKQSSDSSRIDLIKNLRNPYFLGDQPGATQIWGWPNAWTSTPSAYVVLAKTAPKHLAWFCLVSGNHLTNHSAQNRRLYKTVFVEGMEFLEPPLAVFITLIADVSRSLRGPTKTADTANNS